MPPSKQIKHDTALIVFAREPRAGCVKTRLQAACSPETVLRLYKSFVTDVLSQARNVRCGSKWIFYTGARPPLDFLGKWSTSFTLNRQTGKDLGERMARAIQASRKSGARRTVIIGTDCVTLTSRDIEAAFAELSHYDVVLGPSDDGGYYLFGTSVDEPAMFDGVEWGTGQVFEKTVRNVRNAKLSLKQLKVASDIDTPADLEKHKRNPHLKEFAPNTYRILKRL